MATGWAVVCVLLLAPPVSPDAQCKSSVPSPRPPPASLGGLGPLARAAEMGRITVLGDDLDYQPMVDTIRSMYRQSMFSEEQLVSLAWVYTQQILLLAAFVLFTAAALPLLIFCLCLVKEKCCCQDEEEQHSEEENRNLSLQAQIVAWCLCTSVGVCLLFLLGWVSVLLASDAMVHGGVEQSGQYINATLPLLERLQIESLDTAHDVVFGGFQSLNYTIFNNNLRSLPMGVSDSINQTQITDVPALLNKVSDQFSRITEVSQWLRIINNTQLQLELLSTTIDQVNIAVNNITQCCSEANSSVSLTLSCQQLLANSTHPLHQPNIVLSPSSLISNLTKSSASIAGSNPLSLVDAQRNEYEQYLQEIVKNTTADTMDLSDQFLDSLHVNLSQFMQSTQELYNNSTITLGLPRSQQDVASHIGPRYLANWQEFRHLVTIAFSLSMFVLVIGVCVASGRGLLNIWLVYHYQEPEVDKSILFGAHQAGLALRRMAGWMALAGFVSVFFFLFLLCTASLLGRVCGPDKNFTLVITHVFDNTSTWDGRSPLDQTFLESDTSLLSVGRLLKECSQNSSLVDALELNRRLNIGININVSATSINKYRDDVRAVVSSYPSFPILTPELSHLLHHYQHLASSPVDWTLYTNLSSDQQLIDLITKSSQLHQVLSDLPIMPSCIHSPLIFSTTEQLQMISSVLHTVNTTLPKTAQLLETELERVLSSNPSLTAHDAVRLSRKLDREVERRVHAELTFTSTTVIDVVNKYLNNTQNALLCSISHCYPLYDHFANFSNTTCNQLLVGMDVYWASLLAVYIVLTVAMLFTIVLASRFTSKEAVRQLRNARHAHFSLVDHIFSQMSGSLWLLFSLAVQLWFAVSIATDTEICTDNGCCSSCVWISAGVFLLLGLIVGAGLRVYQWILLHRINTLSGPRSQHMHKYWLTRIHMVHFTTQLLLFLLQDIPFVALSGVYMTNRGLPTAAAFFTLAISLFNIAVFLWALVSGCGQLGEYFTWLQLELKALLCCPGKGNWSPGHRPSVPDHYSTTNGATVYLPEVTEDGVTQSVPVQDRYPSHSPVDHLHMNGTMNTSFTGPHPPLHPFETEPMEQHDLSPPTLGVEELDDDGPLQPPQRSYADPVKLDISVDDNMSELGRRREKAAFVRRAGVGVEVMEPMFTRRSYAEASTPRSSNYYSSKDSIAETDLHSSVPSGYTSTDESCREDFDYDSDYPSRLPRQLMGGISVDV